MMPSIEAWCELRRTPQPVEKLPRYPLSLQIGHQIRRFWVSKNRDRGGLRASGRGRAELKRRAGVPWGGSSDLMREAGEPSTWVGEVAEPYVNAGRSQGQKRKAVRRGRS